MVILEEEAAEFVIEDSGKLKIDWRHLIELSHEYGTTRGRGTYYSELYHNVLENLKEKGVLVEPKTIGSYNVVQFTGFNLNPTSSVTSESYNFTDKKNAQAYARAIIHHKRRSDPVYLTQTIEEIS